MKKVVSRTPRIVTLPIGHCPGCHYGNIIRILSEVLEDMELDGQTVMIPAGGCSAGWGAVVFDVDYLANMHGPGIANAAGIKKSRPETFVLCVVGDGELGAIGPGYLINSLLRGDNITVIALNNACYGNTGGQMAATTPLGMKTRTTPEGRDKILHGLPFKIAELVGFFEGAAFSARVSVHTPAERQRAKKAVQTAFEKQLEKKGFSYVEFVSACPSNWHLDPIESLKFIEETMIPLFPLGIFKNV